MRKLMKKQNGFTLIEMLIVVAIIAILVAVSLPLINGSLEQAREATDAANVRAAKAEILLVYMTGGQVENGSSGPIAFAVNTNYYYDAENGKLTTIKPSKGYGKGTAAGEDTISHKDQVIQIQITGTEEVMHNWVP